MPEPGETVRAFFARALAAPPGSPGPALLRDGAGSTKGGEARRAGPGASTGPPGS